MPITLGLYAIPFGFGPVSKAVAIARAITDRMDVEWVPFGSGISLEFMQREGLGTRVIEAPPSPENPEAVAAIAEGLDGAVVLMDNGWANALASRLPVFFADSLGFMWSKADFAAYPDMNKVKSYYVQDVFGAFEHMKRNTGLEMLKPVSPIINTAYETQSGLQSRSVLHLGGLLNPINPDTTKVYLQGLRTIIDCMELEQPLLLMSAGARTAFPALLDGIDAQSLPHMTALGAIATSAFTWSSPGLTTLLEMAHLGVSTAPLPPQNYSQALNIHNMVRVYGEVLHDVWHFLGREYADIYAGMPEEEGVKMITELNKAKLADKNFRESFIQLAGAAARRKTVLPAALRSENSGAAAIAEDVKRHFA